MPCSELLPCYMVGIVVCCGVKFLLLPHAVEVGGEPFMPEGRLLQLPCHMLLHMGNGVQCSVLYAAAARSCCHGRLAVGW